MNRNPFNMKYRNPLPCAVTLLSVLFALTVSAADKPNVVIMLADNVGYGDIGAYGAGEAWFDQTWRPGRA